MLVIGEPVFTDLHERIGPMNAQAPIEPRTHASTEVPVSSSLGENGDLARFFIGSSTGVITMVPGDAPEPHHMGD
jgi:hypothetical protein